jgi:hypothetical protein
MKYIFLMEMFGFFGLIWLMARMYKFRKLTEQFFAILSLTYISLFLLTGFLMVPPTYVDLFIWAIITILVWLIGYPFAKWIYRQMISPK